MKNNKLTISGLNFKLSEEIKFFINNKSQKLFKHQNLISNLRYELEKDIHSSSHEKEYIVKGHMEIKGQVFCFTSSSDSMYKSIDSLIQKLDRGIRRRSKSLKLNRKPKLSNVK